MRHYNGKFGLAGFGLTAGLFVACDSLADDVAHGLEIARRWCVSCHVVEPSKTASDAVPSFWTISQDSSLMSEPPQNWFMRPHPSMPDFALTSREENDLAAYIRSLKSKK